MNRRKKWTGDRFRKQWNFLKWQAYPVANGKEFNSSARSNAVPAQKAKRHPVLQHSFEISIVHFPLDSARPINHMPCRMTKFPDLHSATNVRTFTAVRDGMTPPTYRTERNSLLSPRLLRCK